MLKGYYRACLQYVFKLHRYIANYGNYAEAARDILNNFEILLAVLFPNTTTCRESFSCKRLSLKTRFETEAQSNSEMS